MGQYAGNRCSDHILLLVCNSLTSPGIAPGILIKRLPLPGKRRSRTRYGESRKRKEKSDSCVAGNGGISDIPDVSRAVHNGISSDKALLQ